ncbi:MAG: hypothetical protein RBR67_07305 [Desulfobacterium sp.]|jgi:hypothetical protein|nr:hypothetical protein [Desulfobacterium sp.]
MVQGVYQGSIDQKIALYNQIGGDHLGKDLLQKTTNFVGRALSQIFSKDSSNRAVSNLIADIREKSEFGDRYANLAQAKLTALVGRGKPLTGRVAAQVLSEVKIARSEDLAKSANIGINIDTYVADHGVEIDGLMEAAFDKEQGGIGKGLMTQEDKDSIKEKATQRLKSIFTQKSPSEAEMKNQFTEIARDHCRIKIMNFNEAKIDEVVADLDEEVAARLEENGEDGFVLSDAIIKNMKNKIYSKLAIASQKNHRLYDTHDPAIEQTKTRVMDTLVEAFTCISEAEGVPEDVKQILKQSLADDEIMLTRDISLSVIQGYKDGLCAQIAEAVIGGDLSDATLVDFSKQVSSAMEGACKDPDTQVTRSGIDGYSFATVRFGLCAIAMKANGLDQGEGQVQTKGFYDACIDAAGRQEDTSIAIKMETLSGFMSMAADLKPQIETENFLKNNPALPPGAKDMIQDIFANIPYTKANTLQQDALDLVKKHASLPENGLPKDARVMIDRTDPQHPKPVLSFDSTFLVAPELFAREFGETTTVSNKPFGETVLADQFVADLARAPVTIREDEHEVVFTPQEARDAQTGVSSRDSAPGTRLEEKFVQACGGDKNQARALSILLNQSFAGSVAVACVKDGFVPATGGGNIIIGAGTDHGPFNVTAHGQGRYTVEYSGRALTEMLTAGSMTDMDILIQIVGPGEGRTCELELKAFYDIDLSGVAENITEADLAELIQFQDGSPGVSLKFVDK